MSTVQRSSVSPPRANVVSPILLSWLAYFAAVGAWAIVFSGYQAEAVPVDVYASSILIAALCLFPFALWYQRGRPGLPIFELLCLSFLVQYDLPVFLQPNIITLFGRPVQIPWPAAGDSLLLIALGMAAIELGYYAVLLGLGGLRLPPLDLPVRPASKFPLVVLSLGSGLFVALLTSLGLGPGAGSVVGAVLSFATIFGEIGLALLSFWVFGKLVLSPVWAAVLTFTTAALFLLGLGYGLLESAFAPLIIVVVAKWKVTGRLPVILLSGSIAAIVLLNAVKQDYRTQFATGANHVSLIGRLEVWAGDVGSELQLISTRGAGTTAQVVTQPSASRIDFFHTLAAIRAMTPADVPYSGGSTYSYLLYGWVPRLLWPDKPQVTTAENQMVFNYGLLQPAASSHTSIGVGLIAEAYANFGAVGVAPVLALQGAVLGILALLLNGRASEGGSAIFLALAIPLFNGVGAFMAVLYGSLAQDAIVAVLLLRLFAVGWRART